MAQGDDALAVGVAALEGAEWTAARLAFATALETADAPESHEGLGLALWFLGEVPQALVERQRAFDGYVAAGRCDDAARIAVWVSHQHLLAGRASAARGWLARAERTLDGLQASCPGRGWVAVERARHATGLQEQITQARRAMRIGRATGAGDLEVFALSLLGRAVLTSGRRDEGLKLLEEAMAAASSGRVRNVHTLAEAYCNLIEGCAAAGEWERGAEWCELVEDFARAHRTAPLLGACRTIHADVLIATGHWPQAESALQIALQTHAEYVPQMSAPAIAALAELRVRQGRLLDAERLLRGGLEQPGRLRALALLRLAAGRPREAVTLLERAVHAAADHPVRVAQLLAALVDARLACPDPPGAADAATELRDVADVAGIRLVTALADLATARVDAAVGQAGDAASRATRALVAFSRLAMPYETAQARLELARALASTEPARARDEALSALAVFEELGAPRAGGGRCSAAARPRCRCWAEATGSRSADGTGAGGARARVAGRFQRRRRGSAVHHREDRRPPRQSHPRQAGCPQPDGGRGPCREARATGRSPVERAVPTSPGHGGDHGDGHHREVRRRRCSP
jgi:tetratricopeptide (TPR) repeat protein